MMIMFDVGVLLLVVLAACDRPNTTDQTTTVIEAPSPSSSFVENSTETAGIKASKSPVNIFGMDAINEKAAEAAEEARAAVVAVASTLADKADTQEPQPAVVALASRPASRADLNVTVRHHEFTSNGVVADVGGGGGYTGVHDSITGALLEKTNDKGTKTDRDEEDQVIAAAKFPPADVDSSLADKTEREKPRPAVAEAASPPTSFAETHVAVESLRNGEIQNVPGVVYKYDRPYLWTMENLSEITDTRYMIVEFPRDGNQQNLLIRFRLREGDLHISQFQIQSPWKGKSLQATSLDEFKTNLQSKFGIIKNAPYHWTDNDLIRGAAALLATIRETPLIYYESEHHQALLFLIQNSENVYYTYQDYEWNTLVGAINKLKAS